MTKNHILTENDAFYAHRFCIYHKIQLCFYILKIG